MVIKTIGIDVSNSQLEAVKHLGTDATINTLETPDWEAQLRKLTKGGCHAAAVFSASNAAYESATKALRYAFIQSNMYLGTSTIDTRKYTV